MAKRFTETEKWKDPWFRRLDGRMKLLWMWLCDQCDPAGIIEPDMELAAFQIGITVSELDLASFGDRVERLPNGKWILTRFISFQYGELSADCRAHNPVFKSLESNRVSKGYPQGIHTLQDKDKDKDKDRGGAGGEEETPKKTRPPSPVTTTDEEWIQSLSVDPAYTGIDVRWELARAQSWCSSRRRVCSRKFFINWLLRADKTVAAQGTVLPPSKRY